MYDEAAIKKNIRNRRESLGISQTEMARRLDISLNAYRKLEKGKTRIFTNSFRAFAEETSTSVIDLVSGYSHSDGSEKDRAFFESRIHEIETEHSKVIEEMSSEISRLRKEISSLSASLKDKDDVIDSNKKLIRQYERRLEENDSEV